MTLKDIILKSIQEFKTDNGAYPNALFINRENNKLLIKELGYPFITMDTRKSYVAFNGLTVYETEKYGLALARELDTMEIQLTKDEFDNFNKELNAVPPLTKDNIIEMIEKVKQTPAPALVAVHKDLCHCEQSAEISNENELQTNSFHFSWSEHADNYIIEYEIGNTVYLKSDREQNPCTVTGVLLRQNGYVIYEIRCDLDLAFTNGYELSKEKHIY